MTIAPSIFREINDARTLDREVRHIRVTTDAIQGSITTTPITPERARTIRLRAIWDELEPGHSVDADPEVWLRGLEIVMHPEDWMTLCKEFDGYGVPLVQMDARAGVWRVWGIPVTAP